MKRTIYAAMLLASTAFATLPAQADVVLETKLSGTGDNVIFNSLIGNLATGSFSGQHSGFVTFTDLSNDPLFTAAANGNDIKIANTNDLQIQVFDTSLNVLRTATDVFSLKGTGNVTAFVSAVDQFGNAEPVQIFDLGAIDPNAQSGFTLRAILGESITSFILLDVGGKIADFEHYRIDIAGPLAPVPIPGALVLFASGLAGLGMLGGAGKKLKQRFKFKPENDASLA
jgi:hypothetical protein